MRFQLDWQAYFKEFSARHGGSPVLYGRDEETGRGGMLLFRDGWRYGLQHSGPERPPANTREKEFLCKAYWHTRLKVLKQELEELKSEIHRLADLQQRSSASLMVSVPRFIEDEAGRTQKILESTQVDFNVLLDKVRELVDDIREAEQMKEAPPPEDDIEQWSPLEVLSELEDILNE